MRKVSVIFLCLSLLFVLFATEIFVGKWCVESEGIAITFIGVDSVTFTADDVANINGVGTFSFDDTLLNAKIKNGNMNIEIVYVYETTPVGMSVLTQSFILNGDSLTTNPESILLTRCE